MLKDQLLKEAQDIELDVKLDGIFESVELEPEVQAQFVAVFETAVKKHAAALAESRIEAIAEKSDTLVKESVEAASAASEKALVEKADKFFDHVAAEWLKENKVQINRNIKANLFESMFEGIRNLVVEHNVNLPEESVDVVAEMEEVLEENKQETFRLFTALNEAKAELNEIKRVTAVNEAVAGLTESQKEKVHSLVEGLEYTDGSVYATKLSAIVNMASGPFTGKTEAKLDESALVEATKTDINTVEANGLNYEATPIVESVESEKAPANKSINKYVAAAKRI